MQLSIDDQVVLIVTQLYLDRSVVNDFCYFVFDSLIFPASYWNYSSGFLPITVDHKGALVQACAC